MPLSDLLHVQAPIEAYHGDTTPILSSVSARWPADVGVLDDATARLQLRDAHERLVATFDLDAVPGDAGLLEIGGVTLGPADWLKVPRSTEALDYDLEVVHPAVGTVTLLRGSLRIIRDVTR